MPAQTTPSGREEVSWVAVSGLNAELEAVSGFNTIETAPLLNGLIAMRGVYKVKAAGSIAAGTKLFKVAHTPSKARLLDAAVIKKAKEGKEAIPIEINTSGEAFLEKAMSAEETIGFDGNVYSA